MVNNHATSKMLKFYRSNKFYWLLIIILSIALALLAVKVIKHYRHEAKAAANLGKSITYSIKDNKITSALVTTSTPEATDVAKNSALTKPAPIEDNLPKIAVLIANVGLSASTIPAMLALPEKVTIGLSPYAPDLEILAKKFLEAKHELMMSLPLEPVHYPEDDAGPYALITSLDAVDNLERLKYLVNKVKNVVGVFSMDDEKFTNNALAITPIMKALKERNLIYAYAGAKNNLAISQIAAQENFNLVVVDLMIDQNITDEYINAQLASAIDKAKKNGFAVIICHPYPITISALTKWLSGLESNKVSLTTFQDIVNLSSKGKTNAPPTTTPTQSTIP